MDDTTWFAEHTAYLATPEWAFRRGQVLHRDGYRCQARLSGCQGEATQVHHLTYKHWRHEPLFDLTSVCASCHEQITKMDRGQRPTPNRATTDAPGVDIPDLDDQLGTPLSDRLRELLNDGPKQIGELAAGTGRTPGFITRTLNGMPDARSIGVRGWALLDPVSILEPVPTYWRW